MFTHVHLNVVCFRPLSSGQVHRNAAFPHHVPRIPTLPATLLQLDLLRQRRSVALGDLKRVILADVGATLEVFRLAGREFGPEERSHQRIEDCICAIGPDGCVTAVSANPLDPAVSHPEVLEFYEHSRTVAQYCRMIAENSADLNPDQAYLVGLLHDVGTMPGLLGWNGAGVVSQARTALHFAACCRMPAFAMDYFKDVQQAVGASVWPDLVRRAHGVCSSRTATVARQRYITPR